MAPKSVAQISLYLLSPWSKIKFFKVRALALIVSRPLNWHANPDDFIPTQNFVIISLPKKCFPHIHVTSLRAERCEVHTLAEAKDFSSPKHPDRFSGPIQPTMQGVPRSGEQRGRGVKLTTPPSSAEVKNEYRHNFTPSIQGVSRL